MKRDVISIKTLKRCLSIEEFSKKPEYSSQEEINKAIGRILWGNKRKPFSMRRLIMGFMKKKVGGK